jgi:hypothetical protein
VLWLGATCVIVARTRPARRAMSSGVGSPGSGGVLHGMLRPAGSHTFMNANSTPSASKAHGSPALLSQTGLLRHSETYGGDRGEVSSPRESTENARTAAVFNA